MFAMTHVAHEEEPPSSPAAQVAGKASRYLLLILCAGPIALFPVALAVRAVGYLFP